MVTSGLLAARSQDLPFEEALLLRESSRIERPRGRDEVAGRGLERVEALLAAAGCAGRGPRTPRLARPGRLRVAEDVDQVVGLDLCRPGSRRMASPSREMTHANWLPSRSGSWSGRRGWWPAAVAE